MGSDAERVLLRMPAEMRQALGAAATASGRSINSEILVRIAASLAQGDVGVVLREGAAAYNAPERILLDLFRRLPEEKQRALLSLLR